MLERLLPPATKADLRAWMLGARAGARSYAPVAAEVVDGYHQLLVRQSAGQLSTIDRQLAHERIVEVCAELAPPWPKPGLAVLLDPQDERPVGLALAALCLQEQGFTTRWVPAVAVEGADLVVMAAPLLFADTEALAAKAAQVRDAARARLIVVGRDFSLLGSRALARAA